MGPRSRDNFMGPRSPDNFEERFVGPIALPDAVMLTFNRCSAPHDEKPKNKYVYHLKF
jgi:hypothetical protein